MQALSLIRQELARFVEQGPDQQEVARTVEQLKSSALMSLESMNSRMTANARSEYLYGRPLTAEDIIRGYDAVTREGVHQLAQRLLDFGQMSFSTVGQVSKESEYKDCLIG